MNDGPRRTDTNLSAVCKSVLTWSLIPEFFSQGTHYFLDPRQPDEALRTLFFPQVTSMISKIIDHRFIWIQVLVSLAISYVNLGRLSYVSAA